MGAGAAAGLKEAIDAASTEDLREVLAPIEAEYRAKLITALCDRGCAQVPTPEEFIANFEVMDFGAQPYAQTMFETGREPKSDAEKVFRTVYTESLLGAAITAAEPVLGAESETIKILKGMPQLTKTIVYDQTKWDTEVVPLYKAALDALHDQSEKAEVVQLKEMLIKVGTTALFWSEVQNPKQDYYMCMLDDMHVKYSKGKKDMKVSQESLRQMHSMDMPVHIARSDKRRDVVASFYARIYEAGIAGQKEWDLDAVLAEHGTKEEMKMLWSVTPMTSFELDQNEPGFPGYVLMEGSGRLVAINAALDMVRSKFPDFVAPSISISVRPFDGPQMVRKNLKFFLLLTWRCTFPALDIPGWQNLVSDSNRPVSEELAEVIKSRPRYFGYSPLSAQIPDFATIGA